MFPAQLFCFYWKFLVGIPPCAFLPMAVCSPELHSSATPLIGLMSRSFPDTQMTFPHPQWVWIDFFFLPNLLSANCRSHLKWPAWALLTCRCVLGMKRPAGEHGLYFPVIFFTQQHKRDSENWVKNNNGSQCLPVNEIMISFKCLTEDAQSNVELFVPGYKAKTHSF